MSGSTTPTYVDAGWSGTPAAVAAALAGYGYQVNSGNSTTQIDPTKQGSLVGVTGYTVLDGVAYVLVRSTAAIPLPTGVTALGPQTTAAIAGTFMSGTTNPTSIPSLDFFNRFTPTETTAIWQAAVANPSIGVGLINGLAAGTIDLTSATVSTWLAALVTAGVITAARQTVILTP